MTTIQRITLDGKTYVLLSEEAYEDLIDTTRAGAILSRVRAGEETWPAELVQKLLAANDSPIRTFRKYRGMTITALAKAASLSQPHLSDIENGKRTGSVEVLKRIAAALDVDLDDIVRDVIPEDKG